MGARSPARASTFQERPTGRSWSLRAVTTLTRFMAQERGNVVLEPELVEEEELWRGEEGVDHTGWACVSTDPFPCPANGCTFVAEFMTAAHLVLVWQERDDPNLLRHAERAKSVGRNPRVVQYEAGFGPSVSYYAWEAAGRPVHGVRGK